MNKKDLLIGYVSALVINIICSIMYLLYVSRYELIDSILLAYQNKILTSIILIGALPNILFFFLLLKLDKETTAKGVVFASITTAIITFIIKLA